MQNPAMRVSRNLRFAVLTATILAFHLGHSVPIIVLPINNYSRFTPI
jgi:hypothetical protein